MSTRTVRLPSSRILALVTLLGCSHGATAPTAPEAAVTTSGDTASAPKRIPGRELVYTDGTTEMKGYIAYPEAEGPRPAVLVVHEWWGLNDYAKSRVEQLAGLGYVAFAVDMYGGGKNTVHAADAQGFMAQATKSQEEAKGRFEAALDVVASDPHVNREKIAAIGYCFGGAVVLGMARAGADLDLVASFHGALGTEHPMQKGAFKGKIFVAQGAADAMVPEEQVQKLRAELDNAGANYEVVEYPGAKHGFTNPGATALGEANKIPLAYDPAADAASWQRFMELLEGV